MGGWKVPRHRFDGERPEIDECIREHRQRGRNRRRQEADRNADSAAFQGTNEQHGLAVRRRRSRAFDAMLASAIFACTSLGVATGGAARTACAARSGARGLLRLLATSGGDDVDGDLDVVTFSPGNLLSVREAAAVSPAGFGVGAAAGAVLAGKRRARRDGALSGDRHAKRTDGDRHDGQPDR